VTRTLVDGWRRIAAGTLVVLTVGLSAGPALHAGDGHDADCDPVVVVHDESQHRFAARPEATPFPSEAHCVVCHLFRVSRVSHDDAAVDGFDPAPRVLGIAVDDFRVSVTATVPLPARAPPVRA
jgi:hypothetical protein